jgi:DDE superfamily endonuclease/Transposase
MTIINEQIARDIETLRNSGLGVTAIAEQLGLKNGTLKKHIKKVDILAELPPQVERYRGAVQSRKQLQIKRFISSQPTATLAEINDACGLDTSITTLHRYLKHAGIHRTAAKHKIVLSEANRIKRLEFAREMVLKDDDYLSRIMWSDETKVQAFPNSEAVFFRAKSNEIGSEYVVPKKQNGGSGVMFWGCMTRRAWGPLVVIDGTINGETYLQLLKDVVLPEIGASTVPIIFQQDNAPAHKKASVTTFLSQQNFETLQWPPQSPDLSPIEWIWNCVKMKMKALRPRPRTMATMRDAILDIWNNLEDSIRIKTIDTFRARLNQCIEKNGGFTEY